MKLEIEIKMSYNDIRFFCQEYYYIKICSINDKFKDSSKQEYHYNISTFSFYRTLFILKFRTDVQICHNMSLHFPDSMTRFVA